MKWPVLLTLSAALLTATAAPQAGIGARLVDDEGKLKISSVTPGGPAAKSQAIEEDDTLIAVAQGTEAPVDVTGKTVAEAAALIKGDEGSEVRLTLIPADSQYVKQKIVALRRAKVDTTAAAPKPAPEERGALEVGTEAPDITFTTLDDGKEQKLSDLKGKVRVIDFWATWCGPCQAPMAKMQTYAEKHPEFGDKVVFMSMSVDDKAEVAKKHLTAKGWNKTLNGWTTEEGARAYRIFSIPQVYILDAEGKIAAQGHPMSINIPEVVQGLLNAKAGDPK